MKPRTLEQNNRLHGLLTTLALWPQKKALVLQYTDQRTEKSSEMSFDECQLLINALNSNKVHNSTDGKMDRMRKKVIGICHDMGWQNADSTIDLHRINSFLLSDKSSTKKELNDLSEKELHTAIHQFDKLREYHLKHVQ